MGARFRDQWRRGRRHTECRWCRGRRQRRPRGRPGARGVRPGATGVAYVVLGRGPGSTAGASFPAILELSTLNGADGFAIPGLPSLNGYSNLGSAVGGGGDINGDGIGDIVLGDDFGSPSLNRIQAGQAYVIFGQTSFSAPTFNLASLNGSNGFLINGKSPVNVMGLHMAGVAGDVNGDGVDDVMLGSFLNGPAGASVGGNYIICGKTTASAGPFPAVVEVSALDGSNGFVIYGAAADDLANKGSAAGDVNGDGYDDILIGADNADPNGITNAGQSYIVYGRSSFGASFQLSSLLAAGGGDGSLGYALNGFIPSTRAGSTSRGSETSTATASPTCVSGITARRTSSMAMPRRPWSRSFTSSTMPRRTDLRVQRRRWIRREVQPEQWQHGPARSGQRDRGRQDLGRRCEPQGLRLQPQRRHCWARGRPAHWPTTPRWKASPPTGPTSGSSTPRATRSTSTPARRRASPAAKTPPAASTSTVATIQSQGYRDRRRFAVGRQGFLRPTRCSSTPWRAAAGQLDHFHARRQQPHRHHDQSGQRQRHLDCRQRNGQGVSVRGRRQSHLRQSDRPTRRLRWPPAIPTRKGLPIRPPRELCSRPAFRSLPPLSRARWTWR